MLLRIKLCWMLTCLLSITIGSCQIPPESCVRTFRIEQDRTDIFIMPGVINCFSCALDTNGIVAWQITVDGRFTLVSAFPNVTTDGNFLVIAMPESYVQPGTSGRRNIICTSLVSGQRLEARLASPVLNQPIFTNATVNEGELLRITCVTRNIPNIITFQIFDPNGLPVPNILGVIIVPNVSRTFAGTYTCVVSSTLDNSIVNETATVIVQYMPEIISINSSRSYVLLRQELRLLCGYAGVPAATVQWFHNSTLLTNGSDEVSIIGGAEGDNYTRVVIDMVNETSGGIYTCRANNGLGSDEVNYTVHILSSTQTPPASCVHNFRIEQDRFDIYIEPGVVNCFSCALDTMGNVDWRVTLDGDLVQSSESPNAEAVGNFLVIAMPDNYVLPGTAGRRNILCINANGQSLEARLASPILNQPIFTNATVNEGELLKIVCITRNIPDITTLRIFDPNGLPVPNILGIVSVPNVSRTFAGTYTCVVSSTFDNSTVNETATVIVQHVPEVTPANSSTHYIMRSQDLHLQCDFAGVPVPTLQWFHNSTLLMSGSDGVSITSEFEGDNYTTSSIVIDMVDETSGGIYTCRASNILGSDEVNYTVHISLESSIVIVPPPQVQALCSVIVWYSPDVSCEDTIGYDVRFYDPQMEVQNVTRRVGANGTFYIIQDEDRLINEQELYVQVRVVHRTVGEWSEGVSLGCDRPTSPPETPSVYFELKGVTYTNNSIVSLSNVRQGRNALLCKTKRKECCVTPSNRLGEFYYPSGIKVPIAKLRQGFYRNRGENIVRLNRRRRVTSPKGKYRCEIPDANGTIQNIYINLI